MFGAFLFVLERWHSHFRKWHSHLQKCLSWLTPYSFDVAFHSVIRCPITICIFTFHVVNLHSNHWLCKCSWVGYIHLSDWSSSWAQTRIFSHLLRICLASKPMVVKCYANQTVMCVCVCVVCVCVLAQVFLKKKKKRKNEDKLSKLSLCYAFRIRFF